MPPAGFEPAIPANERSQIHALDRVKCIHTRCNIKARQKAVRVQAWTGSEDPWKLRFPDFTTIST